MKPSAIAAERDQITDWSAAILEVDVVAYHGSCISIRSLPLAVLTLFRFISSGRRESQSHHLSCILIRSLPLPVLTLFRFISSARRESQSHHSTPDTPS